MIWSDGRSFQRVYNYKTIWRTKIAYGSLKALLGLDKGKKSYENDKERYL